jgi:alpha-beta hydrolase superfamily lysophospholipase
LLVGVKSYRKKTTSTPPFAVNTVILQTSDGVALEAWESIDRTPDSMGHAGTIIMFHGHAANKSDILEEAQSFQNMNYRVLLVDFRAHGNSEGSVCTIGAEEAKDVKAAYDHVKASGEENIIFWGISMGAAAQMKAVHDFELKPSRMILEMPFGSLLGAVKGRCRIMGVPAQPVSSLLTFWGSVERGFNGFDHNPEDYAKKINCPVLLQWGTRDVRVTEGETDRIFQNMVSKDKYLVKYTGSGHQSLLVNERSKWTSTVAAFLQEK